MEGRCSPHCALLGKGIPGECWVCGRAACILTTEERMRYQKLLSVSEVTIAFLSGLVCCSLLLSPAHLTPSQACSPSGTSLIRSIACAWFSACAWFRVRGDRWTSLNYNYCGACSYLPNYVLYSGKCLQLPNFMKCHLHPIFWLVSAKLILYGVIFQWVKSERLPCLEGHLGKELPCQSEGRGVILLLWL